MIGDKKGSRSAWRKQPINRRSTDLKSLCDFSGTETLLAKAQDLIAAYRRLPPLVDALCLRLSDTLHLPFAPEVGLELRKHPQHVEKGFSSCGRGIDGLLSCLQRDLLAL